MYKRILGLAAAALVAGATTATAQSKEVVIAYYIR